MIVTSVNWGSFIFSFPICMPFISPPPLSDPPHPSWVIVLAKTSTTVLNRRGDSRDILAFFVNFRVELSTFYHFCVSGELFLSIFFIESFQHERILNFVKCFFCMYWDDHVIFIFYSVNVMYHVDWLMCMLKHPQILGINPTWSWYSIYFVRFFF